MISSLAIALEPIPHLALFRGKRILIASRNASRLAIPLQRVAGDLQGQGWGLVPALERDWRADCRGEVGSGPLSWRAPSRMASRNRQGTDW